MTFIEEKLFHDKKWTWPFTKSFRLILLAGSRDAFIDEKLFHDKKWT
jgi:hypothetical protein